MELVHLFINDNPEDKSGVSAIALVDAPAIEEGFLAFGKQPKLVKHTIFLGKEKGNFTPVNGDQQILAGPLMIPNKKIPRREGEREFEVTFSVEQIRKIREKYALSNKNTAINQMHNNSTPVLGGLVEHFEINREQGKFPPFKMDQLEDGTWFGFIKVNDKTIWDNFIKTGIYTGFSVEGYFYEKQEEPQTQDDFLTELFDWLNKNNV